MDGYEIEEGVQKKNVTDKITNQLFCMFQINHI